jgi:predicted P-loop ATPase
VTAPKKAPITWAPIFPVPDDAPPGMDNLFHSVRGKPESTYTYLDARKRLLGYMRAFRTSSGSIEQIPLTYCLCSNGKREWHAKAFPEPRPLYGLPGLAAQSNGQVLLVKDEATSDLVCFKVTEYAGITWQGGIRAIKKTDWSALAKARRIVIWLPADAERYDTGPEDPRHGQFLPLTEQPHAKAALRIAQVLHALKVDVLVVELTPGKYRAGWDIAQALEDGWNEHRLFDFIEEHAQLYQPPAAVEKPQRAPKAAPEQEEIEDEGTWAADLLRRDGDILPEVRNVRIILSNHRAWRDVIAHDDFAHRVMKRKPPPFAGAAVGEWADHDDTMTADWLAGSFRMLKLPTSRAAEGVHAVARLNAYNPLRQFLEACEKKWLADKHGRLDQWLITYMGAEPLYLAEGDDGPAFRQRSIQYLHEIGALWLTAAVRRVYQPGCKFDHVLILEGAQGVGKSSVFAILGGEWAMDTPIKLGDKEGMETIQGMWLVVIDELDALNKAESTTAKNFFTRERDRFRLPYGKRSAEFLRSCVFGGTTNEHEYLRDSTGNRRYLPALCRSLEREKLVRDRELLLGEAVHRHKSGASIFLSPELRVLVDEQTELRRVADPWESQIPRRLAEAAWDGRDTRLSMSDILFEVLKIEPGRADERSMATRAGRVMRKLGYIKKEVSRGPDRFLYIKEAVKKASGEDKNGVPI